jgi:hypothetical protein
MEWIEIGQLSYSQEIVGHGQYGVITWLYIDGPKGAVKAYDCGYITAGYYEQYPDRLWDLYMDILAVLDGYYHCCLTAKVWSCLSLR